MDINYIDNFNFEEIITYLTESKELSSKQANKIFDVIGTDEELKSISKIAKEFRQIQFKYFELQSDLENLLFEHDRDCQFANWLTPALLKIFDIIETIPNTEQSRIKHKTIVMKKCTTSTPDNNLPKNMNFWDLDKLLLKTLGLWED